MMDAVRNWLREGQNGMSETPAEIECELIDLSHVTVDILRSCPDPLFAEASARFRHRVADFAECISGYSGSFAVDAEDFEAGGGRPNR